MRGRWFLAILLTGWLAAAPAWQKEAPASPININTATAQQLVTLPGVGPSMAKAIIDFRSRNGPFRRVEELLIIKGMSKKKLAKLRPYLKVS